MTGYPRMCFVVWVQTVFTAVEVSLLQYDARFSRRTTDAKAVFFLFFLFVLERTGGAEVFGEHLRG